MSSMVRGLATLGAFSLLTTSLASANSIINGSFETPALDSGTAFKNYGNNSADNAGNFDANWKITENNVDIVNGSVPGNGAAYQGNQFLDLVGYGDKGTIEQTFATTIGQKYAFSFAYANNPLNIGGNPSAAATVHLLGSGLLLSDTVSHGGSSAATMNWLLYSIVFEADAIETTVRFQNTVGGGNGGILLDAVSVEAATAVPVPAALPLFASGLGLLGFAGWRKRRKVAS